MSLSCGRKPDLFSVVGKRGVITDNLVFLLTRAIGFGGAAAVG